MLSKKWCGKEERNTDVVLELIRDRSGCAEGTSREYHSHMYLTYGVVKVNPVVIFTQETNQKQ